MFVAWGIDRILANKLADNLNYLVAVDVLREL